jgi:hypothetical protein
MDGQIGQVLASHTIRDARPALLFEQLGPERSNFGFFPKLIRTSH